MNMIYSLSLPVIGQWPTIFVPIWSKGQPIKDCCNGDLMTRTRVPLTQLSHSLHYLPQQNLFQFTNPFFTRFSSYLFLNYQNIFKLLKVKYHPITKYCLFKKYIAFGNIKRSAAEIRFLHMLLFSILKNGNWASLRSMFFSLISFGKHPYVVTKTIIYQH